MRLLPLLACLAPACATAQEAPLSPLETDPSEMVFFMALPPELAPVPASAELLFVAERTDTGATLSESFTLKPEAVAGDVYRFGFAKEDLDRFRTTQATALKWSRNHADVSTGRLTSSLRACAIGAAQPETRAGFSVALSKRDRPKEMQLIAAAEVQSLLEAEGLDQFPPCK